MASLSVKYLGLDLPNPIIIGSSGLSGSIEKIKLLAENGAGAIVLRSLFEEQINHAVVDNIKSDGHVMPEAFEHLIHQFKDKAIEYYLELIKQAKKTVDIPIIASINCISASEWTLFARKIRDAGADALELNIFLLPTDINKNCLDYEKKYFDIISKVQIDIPLVLKMGYYSSGLAHLVHEIGNSGKVSGIVLFNRHYAPDIDIQTCEFKISNMYSSSDDIFNSLRWIYLLSDKVKCDLAASTGVHDAEGVIKMILSGAKAVQVTSAIYKHGPKYISEILKGIEDWMNKNNYESIDDFRGKLCVGKSKDAAVFERVQYIKHFVGIE